MNVNCIKSKVNRAFSLIELMVVIAIVALLTAIAVPSYQGYLQQSKVTEIFSLASDQMNQWAQKYNTGGNFATFSNTALGSYIQQTALVSGTAVTSATGTGAPGNFTTTNCPTNGVASPAGGLGSVCIQLVSSNVIDSSLNGLFLVFTPRQSGTSSDSGQVNLDWTCTYKAGSANSTIDTLLGPGNCTFF